MAIILLLLLLIISFALLCHLSQQICLLGLNSYHTTIQTLNYSNSQLSNHPKIQQFNQTNNQQFRNLINKQPTTVFNQIQKFKNPKKVQNHSTIIYSVQYVQPSSTVIMQIKINCLNIVDISSSKPSESNILS